MENMEKRLEEASLEEKEVEGVKVEEEGEG